MRASSCARCLNVFLTLAARVVANYVVDGRTDDEKGQVNYIANPAPAD